MDKFADKIKKINYIAIDDSDISTSGNLYESLRTMAADLLVDYSTICKKLNENKELGRCFVTSKSTKITYYIIKL